MGQGGLLVMINGTSYDWELATHHSYQMQSWSFPGTITAGEIVRVYIEWDQGIFKDSNDDTAEASYRLAGTFHTFEVQARNRWAFNSPNFNLQVKLQSIATTGNRQGSTIQLGWEHNGDVYFILSGKEGQFASSNPPTAWMQENLDTLGPRSLRRLCIPGSHNSGMSVFKSGTFYATNGNTVTQTGSIIRQLELGVRYLDCRPVLNGGSFVAGHYHNVNLPTVGWQGGNGQFFTDIIREINAFTNNNKELIILRLSHDINSDVGRDYRSLNQDEWNRLLEQLMGVNGLKNLFVARNPTSVDLTTLALKDFIHTQAAVVIIAKPDNKGIMLGGYHNRGAYNYSQMKLYSSYSNTNDVDEMVRDQLQKMRDNRTTHESGLFLLSWTLTQSKLDSLPLVGSPILTLAERAMPRIYTDVVPACSNNTYPNILYLDGLNSNDIAALAMAINGVATTG